MSDSHFSPHFGRLAAVNDAPRFSRVAEQPSNFPSQAQCRPHRTRNWASPAALIVLVCGGLLLLARPCAAAVTISSFSCANSIYTGSGMDSCTVTMSGVVNRTNGRTVMLSSNNPAVQVPSSVYVPQGSTSVTFSATIAAVSMTQTATTTAHTYNGNATFTIQLDPATTTPATTPVLSGVSCGNASVTGAGSDACAVSVSAAAPSGGFAVALASNNSALSVPASVTVPAGATSAAFTATASAVSTTQMATITSTANGVSRTYSVQLNASASSATHTYSTNFPQNENPVFESGNWMSGVAATGYWTNMQSVGGYAYGTCGSSGSGCFGGTGSPNDSTALLTGTWGPNQTVTIKVHQPGPLLGQPEVEIRLRSTFASGGYCSGYEVDASAGYIVIVKWAGPSSGPFTQIKDLGSSVKDGDTLTATISGTSSTVITVYKNGTLLGSVTDSSSPFTSGNPGMGWFISSGGTPSNADSISSFSASD